MEILKKARTGIAGLDEMLDDGLLCRRPMLVCGGRDCGKTMLSAEFLYQETLQFAELGLRASFEESKEDIRSNFVSPRFRFREALSEFASANYTQQRNNFSKRPTPLYTKRNGTAETRS